MPPFEARRLLVVLAAVAMLAAVANAYAPAREAELVWDDHTLLEREAPWQEVAPEKLFLEPFWPASSLSDARASYYRPVVLLSFRLDRALGGTNREFHFTNYFLHLVACALLAVWASRAGATGGAAVLAALFWGLNPRLTEAVAWISGRTDVLAATFTFAALCVSPDTGGPPPRSVARARMRAALAGVFLLLALNSKEVAVAAALALAVAVLARRDADEAVTSRTERFLRLGLSVALPLAAYGSLRAIALAGASAPARELGVGQRLGTALEALARYAEMVADPFHPQASIGLVGEIDMARAVLGAILLVASVVALVVLRSRLRRGVLVGIALSAAALGVVLHLVPFNMSGAVAADRLLYVPLAGLVVAGAVAARRLRSRGARVAAGLVLFLAWACALVTHRRARDYSNEALFWVDAAETGHPHNTMPMSALGGIVRDAGRVELACRLFHQSRGILERTARSGTSLHRRATENYAGCLALSGRYAEARREYQSLVDAFPTVGRVQMGIAYVHLHELHFDAAELAFARARALDPALGPVIAPGIAEITRARADAERFRDETARLRDRHGYASFLTRVGRRDEAQTAWAALALDVHAPPRERRDALDALAHFGDVPLARRAADACLEVPNIHTSDIWEILPIREKRLGEVVALEARIEALARRD